MFKCFLLLIYFNCFCPPKLNQNYLIALDNMKLNSFGLYSTSYSCSNYSAENFCSVKNKTNSNNLNCCVDDYSKSELISPDVYDFIRSALYNDFNLSNSIFTEDIFIAKVQESFVEEDKSDSYESNQYENGWASLVLINEQGERVNFNFDVSLIV